MLAGEPPFTGPTAQAIMARRLSSPVPSLRTVRETVSPAVERAIEVALAKVPADRFATTDEFVAALDGAGPSDAKPSTAVRGIPRRRVAIAAGIAVAVVAAALALQRWSTPAVLPDTGLVAVVPFRVASSDSSLAYLHEGLVDLFAAKLNGEAGPRSVDPRAVMRLWNASAEGRSDLPEGEVLRLARRVGAGRLLTGSIVGTAERLVLSAAVVDVSTGRPRQQATVDGSHDSLPYLVDRLAGQLLALGAGFQSQQLASLTSASLPALRAYLTGASAARAGRWSVAIEDFNRALKLDSAFALAGLGLASASAWLDGSESERGRALAWAAKDRLGWRDRTFLDAVRRNTLQSMQELVQKIPDSPEAWYGLGDKYFHDGALHGVTDADERALAAFRRALALDTATATAPNAEPLAHFAGLALAAGDSATVRRLLSLALAQDSTGEFTAMHRLELARASGDTAAINRWHATLDRANIQTLVAVGLGRPDGRVGSRRAARDGDRHAQIRPSIRLQGVPRLPALPGPRPRSESGKTARGPRGKGAAIVRHAAAGPGIGSRLDGRCPLLGRGYHRCRRGGGEDREGCRPAATAGSRLLTPPVLLRCLYARTMAPGAR